MKTPAALQPLIDDGVIDEVVRSLKSGKEATVYLMRSGMHTRCAKVYRDMGQRSFQKRARYQEGRKVRGSRQARAMRKSTHFGRREQEAAWKNAEVDALYKLDAAGVRVPKGRGGNGVVRYPRRVSFGQSLYLQVMPTGRRYWHCRYRFEGRQKQLSLGRYPYVPVESARARRHHFANCGPMPPRLGFYKAAGRG